MSNPSIAPSSMSVLIVEDDDFSQEVLLGMLENWGIEDIQTATDGHDGLRVLAGMSRPPDFLICDILMSGMDGMKFLVELAKQKFKGGIILVSGIDSEILAIAKQVVDSDGLNMVGAFVKPIKNDELAKAMGIVH
jgi:CheY-like chemotaxis protein